MDFGRNPTPSGHLGAEASSSGSIVSPEDPGAITLDSGPKEIGLNPDTFVLDHIAGGSFYELFQAIPSPTALIDSSYEILFLNRAFGKIVDQYEKFVGARFDAFFADSVDVQFVTSMIRQVFNTRRPVRKERVWSIGGRPLEARLHFQNMSLGRESAVLFMVEDLTLERKKELADDKYRHLARVFPAGIAEFQLTRPVSVKAPPAELIALLEKADAVYWNDEFGAMLGLALGWDGPTGREEVASVLRNNRRVFENWIKGRLQTESFEIKEKGPGGNVRYTETTMVGDIRLGQLHGFWLAKKDISDRKLAELALRKTHVKLKIQLDERNADLKSLGMRLLSELAEHKLARDAILEQDAALQEVIDAFPDPFFVVDAEDFSLKIANAAANVDDIPADSKCYRLIRGFGTPCSGPDTPCPLTEVVQTKAPVTVEHRRESSAGETRHYEVRFFPMLDHQGNVSQIIESASDITARKISDQKSRNSVERLERTLSGTVTALLSLFEDKDPFTALHQKRVAKLCKAIARNMGLPGEMIRGLNIAAGMHDIGKVSVPKEYLMKPGRVTTDEFEVIKRHPQAGYEILRVIDFPWPVAEIILQHHERMNGSGYPNGVKGGRILLEARILGVADVVEAICSRRPYRPALGLQAAMQEINGQNGRLYDPRVVYACADVFKAGFDFN